MEFAALKQKGMSMAEYEAQFTRLAVYAPHLVGTERLKANRFMDGLRPMFIERLGPHNIQTYTEMVQRAQLVEDTMAKVEGMRGKDNSKPVFIKKGAPNIAPTFRNNIVNNNNKQPNAGRDIAGDKRVKMEGRQLSENCKFCDKPGHQAEECWKKLRACLRCGGRDHRILDCPMMKDQPGGAQNAPQRQGRLNAVIEADLPEEGGMVEGTIFIHSQPAFVLIDTGAAYSFISTTFAATLPVKLVPLKSKISVASPLGSKSELTHYLPKCETMIGGHNLPADLICLDMKGYDAILGVDWLIEYDADGRVEEFLTTGEAGDPHTKPFFFPVVSVATCTDHHLEVDQSSEPIHVSSSLPVPDAPEETINEVLRDIRGKGITSDDIPEATFFEEREHHFSPSQFETRPRSQGESSNSLNAILDLLSKQQETLSVLQMQVEFIDVKFDSLSDEVK
ncbi:hypothetical protein Taro_028391 [Colocasia esculenta]|uniref:CCHC-type domain-containing protein n=1 Tax=Colocasia esculenta TaxID=4460 RepID=A0A843VIG2_COLES|nr:hypothetical protein [Colocasia esculenta]